jgi:hypothetical protein
VNLNLVRLRGVERQLRRIADLLEIVVEESYGRRLSPPAPVTGPEPEVLYTDEEADAVREMEELMSKGRVKREGGEEEE